MAVANAIGSNVFAPTFWSITDISRTTSSEEYLPMDKTISLYTDFPSTVEECFRELWYFIEGAAIRGVIFIIPRKLRKNVLQQLIKVSQAEMECCVN